MIIENTKCRYGDEYGEDRKRLSPYTPGWLYRGKCTIRSPGHKGTGVGGGCGDEGATVSGSANGIASRDTGSIMAFRILEK